MGWESLFSVMLAAAVPMAVPLLLVALGEMFDQRAGLFNLCLLYTSPSPRDTR